MGRISNFVLGTPEQREHNARFNNRDTDTESAEHLESHDRVVASQKAAKNKKG